MRKPDQTEKGIHPLFYQYVTKTRFRQVIALGFLLDHFEFEVNPQHCNEKAVNRVDNIIQMF